MTLAQETQRRQQEVLLRETVLPAVLDRVGKRLVQVHLDGIRRHLGVVLQTLHHLLAVAGGAEGHLVRGGVDRRGPLLGQVLAGLLRRLLTGRPVRAGVPSLRSEIRVGLGQQLARAAVDALKR
jgi:hypothetical protein